MSTVKSTLTRLALVAALSASMLAGGTSAEALPGDGRGSLPEPVRRSASVATPATAAASSCSSQVGTPGNIYAKSFAKRDWALTGGLHMDTRGTLDRNTGVVGATVHIYNSYWGTGYTGTVMLVLRDNCGGVIGVTEPKKWGVEAKAWFWNANERREHYSAQVAPEIASRVASVEVIHNRYSNDAHLRAAYNALRDIGCAKLENLLGGTCPIPELKP
ncbi:hypothetical protein [Tessaracoccus caeni]|uniref:hypothetical protein n=1 Tax=Tessaracoccus caeni TaxID=3031239 RepID=UPI0023DAEFFA|nr:hypothetical protein [Tessaracoccus caeni]MDF1489607.1 hypothetical protein [Tessaracoccus caeni]